jgi:hypothetical protein
LILARNVGSVLAGLRRTWRRALVVAQVVGGALLLGAAVGALRQADGGAAVLALAAVGAVVGIGLLVGAARTGR